MRDPRRIRLFFALAVVTSITLLATSSGLIGSNARAFTSAWMSPLQVAGHGIASPFHSLATAIGDLATLRDENTALRKDNDSLHSRLVTSLDDHQRLGELESMLGLVSKGQYKIVTAHVVAWPQSEDTGATVQIDAGRRDGLRVGMTVLSGKGLVGATTSVGASTATVRLFTDPDSHVGVRVARTSAIGVASGSGRDEDIHLDMFSMLDLKVGDPVVTRGSLNGIPFVPGVPVGRIVTVGGTAGELPIGTIKPYIDVNALTVVGVVVAVPKLDPRDGLIPKPLPTPTITVRVTVTAPPAASTTPAPLATPTPAASPRRSIGKASMSATPSPRASR